MPSTGPVFLYIRVSTEEQSREGYSIDAQETVLRAWCVVKGYTNIEVFNDAGHSAKNLNRPELTRMLQRIRQGGVQALLVWKLDRLSRSLKDTLHIVEDVLQPAGCELVSTSESIDTQTTAGRLMLNVLASFAQAERENTAQRIQMVSRELAKSGHHMGGVPPFGYKLQDGTLTPDEPAASAVREIFRMYIDGHGYSAIIRYLSSSGFKTVRGNDFTKPTLHDLLKNEKYTGTYTWNRSTAAKKSGARNHHASKDQKDIIRIENAFPALITRDTFDAAQATFRKNARRAAAYTAKQVYTLSGIIFCGVCGSHMNIKSGSKDRDGTIQRYYACSNKCVTAARKEDVESYVFITIQAWLSRRDTLIHAAQVANTLLLEGTEEDKPLIKQLKQAIRDTDKQLSAITAFIAKAGAQAPATLLLEMETLEAHKSTCQEHLNRLQNTAARVDGQAMVRNLVRVMKAQKSPQIEQKAAIQRAISRVTVTDDTYKIDLSNCTTTGGGEGFPLIVQSEITRRIRKRKDPIYIFGVTSVTSITSYKISEFLPIRMQKQKVVTLHVTQKQKVTL